MLLLLDPRDLRLKQGISGNELSVSPGKSATKLWLHNLFLKILLATNLGHMIFQIKIISQHAAVLVVVVVVVCVSVCVCVL